MSMLRSAMAEDDNEVMLDKGHLLTCCPSDTYLRTRQWRATCQYVETDRRSQSMVRMDC